jgi:hypothetical protein
MKGFEVPRDYLMLMYATPRLELRAFNVIDSPYRSAKVIHSRQIERTSASHVTLYDCVVREYLAGKVNKETISSGSPARSRHR